jgi:hypothetical protein
VPENWLPVPGWPYEASSRGRVRSLARRRPLKPQRDGDGYRYVELSDGARRERVHVARVVLLAFAGPPPEPGMEACHRHGRRGDNRPGGLYWGTSPENRADRERHRRERAVRRTGESVTDVTNEKQGEIEETAACPMETGTGVSP